MFKVNKLWTGSLIGLAMPLFSFFMVEVLKMDFRIQQKEHILYLACAAINLLLLRYYHNLGAEDTAKGIIASTFVSMFAILIFKRYQ